MSGKLHIKPTKTKVKKIAYKWFALYLRTLWTTHGTVNCYTCDKPLIFKQAQVGHWVEGHANSTYINEDYVRPQCFYCNIQLGGNQGEFRDRLRKELGDKIVDKLLLEAKSTKDITVDDYIELARFYKEQYESLLS